MEQLQARLAELKQEYQTGEARLRELVAQEAALRETMLRISGAIQVLEELLASDARPADPQLDGPPPSDVLTVP